jgi:hypothetical protein
VVTEKVAVVAAMYKWHCVSFATLASLKFIRGMKCLGSKPTAVQAHVQLVQARGK